MSKLTFTESHFNRHRCCRHRLHYDCRYYHHKHHQHHYYYHCHYHYRYRFHHCFFYYHCTGICRKCRESFESKSQIDQLTLTVKDLKMVSNLIVIAALEETAPGKAEILLNKLVISNDVAQTEDQVATRMRATGAHVGKSYPLLLTKLTIERYRVGFLV